MLKMFLPKEKVNHKINSFFMKSFIICFTITISLISCSSHADELGYYKGFYSSTYDTPVKKGIPTDINIWITYVSEVDSNNFYCTLTYQDNGEEKIVKADKNSFCFENVVFSEADDYYVSFSIDFEDKRYRDGFLRFLVRVQE